MFRPRDLAYLLAGLVAAPLWGWRLWRTGKWRTDWRARFGAAPSLPAGPRTLLLHGVSLGEVNATRSLVAALSTLDPSLRIVVSATTDTGFARARTLYAPAHPVVRFPFDVSPAVGRFLDAVRPDAVALMELELWPTFMDECRAREIPVAVVNGRLSPRSYRRYRAVAKLVRPMFSRLALAAVQTEEYAKRFAALGTPPSRIHVVDNLKWEVALPGELPEGAPAAAGGPAVAAGPATREAAASGAGPATGEGPGEPPSPRPPPGHAPGKLARALGIDPARPLVVAGSTAPGEEERLVAGLPDQVQVLLAPRHPERFDEVAAAFPGVVRRTAHPDGTRRAPDPATRIFLLDTLGELANAYALADVAVVGRSFVPGFGGSDPIEPAARGRAVIIGPDHGNFSDVVDAFLEAGGIRIEEDPARGAIRLLEDPSGASLQAARALDVIRRRRGAARRTARLLLSLGRLAGPGAPTAPGASARVQEDGGEPV